MWSDSEQHGPGGRPAIPAGGPPRAEREDPRLPPRPLHPGQLHTAPTLRHARAGEEVWQVAHGRLRTGRGLLRRHEEEEGDGQGRRGASERSVQVQQQGDHPTQWTLQPHTKPEQEAELRQLHTEEGETEAEDTAGVEEVHQVEDSEEEEEEAEEKDYEDPQQEAEEPIWSHRTVGEENQGGDEGKVQNQNIFRMKYFYQKYFQAFNRRKKLLKRKIKRRLKQRQRMKHVRR